MHVTCHHPDSALVRCNEAKTRADTCRGRGCETAQRKPLSKSLALSWPAHDEGRQAVPILFPGMLVLMSKPVPVRILLRLLLLRSCVRIGVPLILQSPLADDLVRGAVRRSVIT